MTDDEFAKRQMAAAIWLNEPITGWWIEHSVECPGFAGADICTCKDWLLCFTGTRHVAMVGPAYQVDLHVMH